MLVASVREDLRDEYRIGVKDIDTGEGSWELFIDRPCWSHPVDDGIYIVELQDGRKVYASSIDLEFRSK